MTSKEDPSRTPLQIPRHESDLSADESVPLFVDPEDLPENSQQSRKSSIAGKMFSRYGSFWQPSTSATSEETPAGLEGMFSTSHNNKVILYDHNKLLSWSVFSLMGQSVFTQPPVLKTFLFCSTLSFSIALIIIFCVPSASRVDTQRFQILCEFLTVFITFMLGIYVQQAFKHWWYSVATFEKFLSSIRQLIFMLHQIKLNKGFVKQVEDLCVASTYIFNIEVKNALKFQAADHHNIHDLLSWLAEHHFISEKEKDYLNFHKTSAGVMSRTRAVWSFIGEMLAHVHDLTDVTLPPPVETRLISMCQDCIGEIEELKMNITMQTPFMYAHLLAFLVHVNNFVLSATCGICIGSAIVESTMRSEQLHEIHGDSPRDARKSSVDTTDLGGMMGGSMDPMDAFLRVHNSADRSEAYVTKQFYQSIQTMWIQILMVLLGPILHVAFLHIAHLLCYPFGNESYHLPMETLISRLHAELHQMRLNRSFYRDSITAAKNKLSDYVGGDDDATPFIEKESPSLRGSRKRGDEVDEENDGVVATHEGGTGTGAAQDDDDDA